MFSVLFEAIFGHELEYNLVTPKLVCSVTEANIHMPIKVGLILCRKVEACTNKFMIAEFTECFYHRFVFLQILGLRFLEPHKQH